MSDILICIQLQIKCAPFNFLRELWQTDMWDAPHRLNWLQKAAATVCVWLYHCFSESSDCSSLSHVPCCKLLREIFVLLEREKRGKERARSLFFLKECHANPPHCGAEVLSEGLVLLLIFPFTTMMIRGINNFTGHGANIINCFSQPLKLPII